MIDSQREREREREKNLKKLGKRKVREKVERESDRGAVHCVHRGRAVYSYSCNAHPCSLLPLVDLWLVDATISVVLAQCH